MIWRILFLFPPFSPLTLNSHLLRGMGLEGMVLGGTQLPTNKSLSVTLLYNVEALWGVSFGVFIQIIFVGKVRTNPKLSVARVSIVELTHSHAHIIYFVINVCVYIDIYARTNEPNLCFAHRCTASFHRLTAFSDCGCYVSYALTNSSEPPRM